MPDYQNVSILLLSPSLKYPKGLGERWVDSGILIWRRNILESEGSIPTSPFHHCVVLGLYCHSGLLLIQESTELIESAQYHSSECQPFPEQPSLQTPAPLPSTVTIVQASSHYGHSATLSFPSLGCTTSFLPKIKQLSPLIPEVQSASLHIFGRQEDYPYII